MKFGPYLSAGHMRPIAIFRHLCAKVMFFSAVNVSVCKIFQKNLLINFNDIFKQE